LNDFDELVIFPKTGLFVTVEVDIGANTMLLSFLPLTLEVNSGIINESAETMELPLLKLTFVHAISPVTNTTDSMLHFVFHLTDINLIRV
jgi:hypothetical protein